MKAFKIAALTAALAMAGGCTTANKSAGDMLDDSLIQGNVKSKLLAEDFSEAAGLNLETYKGIVQMGGFVDDPAAARRMAEVAASVDGVKRVDNQLHDRGPERSAGAAVDDGVTTTRVKSAISSENFDKGVSINVETYNGVVLLTGFADSRQTKTRAGEIAAADDNAKRVINGINVVD